MSFKPTKLIPKKWRLWLRELPIFSIMLNRRTAKRTACTNKRLDQCLNEFIELNRLTGYTLENKTCLEIGSGWVLSHAVAMIVLGASKVITVDVTRLAFPDTLVRAILEAESAIDWQSLAVFGDISLIKSRYERLKSIKYFTFKSLADLGVEYIAPIDLSIKPLGQPVDFIFSHAVMEHVPVDCVLPLLSNLAVDLTNNGAMYHRIDLCDHEDANAPFAFFTETAQAYSPAIQSARGNRIRKSGWTKILAQNDGISFKYLVDTSRTDAALPEKIDPSVEYTDEMDLRSGYLTVWAVKP